METKLFKTRKLAEKYIRENFNDPLLKSTSITDRTDCDVVDMPNLCWSGETPAYEVIDNNGETAAFAAWWEEGDDEYKLYVGKELAGTFDNNYDAREAYDKAMETEDDKDEDEEEIFEVRLFCNDEDISN